VIYQTPDIKPLAQEYAEAGNLSGKVVEEAEDENKNYGINVLESGQKGQGEYALPSAVYMSWIAKNLGTLSSQIY
jgi:hypothetical protein